MTLRAFLIAAPLLALAAGGASAQSGNQLYAAQCRAAIGALPDFSCDDGVVVPITRNGEPVQNPVAHMTCDRPALLPNGAESDGQCVPYSRILNLSTDKMMVSVMCRRKKIRDADSPYYDEIDVIAHNPATGATCWFQAANDAGAPLSGRHVPSPTSAVDDDFWRAPETVAADGCGGCHDNDPFMYSPFIGQVIAEVPAAPFGPYFHVGPEFGFGAWPTKVFDLVDNTCVSCHRIGMDNTCGELADWMTGRTIPPGADGPARAYPLSHAMPPDFGQSIKAWEVIYGPAAAQIRSCCFDPDQEACRLTPTPGSAH